MLACVVPLLVGCKATAAAGRPASVSEKGLAFSCEVRPDVVEDRVPLRTAVLRFRNTTARPIRVYMPQTPEFRANISTLVLTAGGEVYATPDPRPHGYVVTEADFPEIAPGEERVFEQRFTLDPLVPGAQLRTERRKGFGSGNPVTIRWTYENAITRWEGGKMTMDGPTKPLFDGGDIPNIWTGRVTVVLDWKAP